MERYFAYLNSTNVLESITRSIIDGIFAVAEEQECPYLIEIRSKFEPDNMCAGALGMFWHGEQKDQLRASGMPTVNLSNAAGPISEMGNVLSDDLAVGRMAGRHLLSRGYRQFLGLGVSGVQYGTERLQGFTEELAQHNTTCQILTIDPKMSDRGWSPSAYQEHIWEQVRDSIRDLPMDTGMFAVSDWLAWPILRSVERDFPDRLSTLGMLGVDNLHGGRFDPRKAMRLSSIQPGFHAAGRKSLEILMAHVLDGAPLAGVVHRCPPEGIAERASTAGPACADPLLAHMIRTIWEGLRKQRTIVISDLVRQYGMSASTFEKKFRARLNKSARELIAEMRVDYAKELIRANQHPITEIGYLCGYANPSAFSNAFKNQVGLSPRDWKERDRSGS